MSISELECCNLFSFWCHEASWEALHHENFAKVFGKDFNGIPQVHSFAYRDSYIVLRHAEENNPLHFTALRTLSAGDNIEVFQKVYDYSDALTKYFDKAVEQIARAKYTVSKELYGRHFDLEVARDIWSKIASERKSIDMYSMSIDEYEQIAERNIALIKQLKANVELQYKIEEVKHL